jgi:hypothetical protein
VLPSIALELTARLELRCNTAQSRAIARLPPICSTRQWLTETGIVPFGKRVSTVHGVVFDFFAGELTDPGTEGRERCLRIRFSSTPELKKTKGPVAMAAGPFLFRCG